jgi:hypothetical protein
MALPAQMVLSAPCLLPSKVRDRVLFFSIQLSFVVPLRTYLGDST